ncbi:unnamed protein product [Rangifer tarandus platyrhynchus]|uniref:Uncharacterized protein n=1 Tax=Rangifer tarandus platyrhynchus TaxID=3082113 RepID=A0ABN8YT61_RANTA|nr:unnamed protein product [Rangifer tarandus platyrhynchus]
MRFSWQEYWSGISFNWYCHFLLQGIFLTQGSNSLLGSPAWQADSLPLSHLGSSSRLIRHYVMRRFARERVLKSPNLTCAPALSHRCQSRCPSCRLTAPCQTAGQASG